MKSLLIAISLAAVASMASAKLPPLSPEAKAKADENSAKAAWTGKVDGYLLCKSQDKVATKYIASAKAAGKDIKPASATPCADPGPFAYTPPEQKPLEASGAHSPAGNATSPPSVIQPSASMTPAKKP